MLFLAGIFMPQNQIFVLLTYVCDEVTQAGHQAALSLLSSAGQKIRYKNLWVKIESV